MIEYSPPSKLRRLKESATIKAAEKARELKAKGIKVISLDVGEPDFPTPEPIIEEAYKALKEGYTHYSPSQGIPELRKAIADKIRDEKGLEIDPGQVIITPGAKQSIFYALTALLDEGDEVLIPKPAWPSYFEMLKLIGGTGVEVKTDQNFLPDVEELEKYVSDRTKAIILNYPNNPTGAVYDENILNRLANFVKERGLWVVSDEIYEKLTYEGSFTSFASLPDMESHTITVNGFSKAYAMTGWRLGYAYGPRHIIKMMVKVQQHTATCAPSFIQRAAITALNKCDQYVKEMVNEFKKRRDLIVEGLRRIGFRLEKPRGAFYVFPSVEGLYDNPAGFNEFLLDKAAVSVTPGVGFGQGYESFVRISYANSLENIKEALERIGKALASSS
jgi:aspartate aminotransferase